MKEVFKKSKFVSTQYAKLRKKFKPDILKSQNEEAQLLKKLLEHHPEIPKTFVEFGFSGWEFNCSEIALNPDWKGLLIDGDIYNCWIGQAILGKNIETKHEWITLENISPTIKKWLKTRALGILSVDIDGNDYWMLEKLIEIKPSIIIAEYNSFFEHRSISVPYDPNFDRRNKHPSLSYYGASLKALHTLLSSKNYSMIEVCDSGVNALFLNNDHLRKEDIPLDPERSFQERTLPEGLTHTGIWEEISDMEYIEIS